MDFIDAVIDNRIDDVKHFIAKGANVNATDEFGRSVLWYAATRNNLECCKALLDAKADPNGLALHAASSRGYAECVHLLIQHKADINAVDKNGQSALHRAVLRRHLNCVQLLVTARAEVNRPEIRGDTPLACAIMAPDIEISEYLLHSGAKMKHVSFAHVAQPYWLLEMGKTKCSVMRFVLTLKGVLKKRLAVAKDMVNVIGFYVWQTRLHPQWDENKRRFHLYYYLRRLLLISLLLITV